MTTILPDLERDLRRAARRAQHAATADAAAVPPARPSGRRRLAGALQLTVLAVIVGCVIAGALLLHRRDATAIRSPTDIPSPSSAATLIARAGTPRRALIESLELLRRPRTSADTRPHLLAVALGVPPHLHVVGGGGPLADAGRPALDRALVRVIPLATPDARVIVAPTTFRPTARALREEGIVLTVTGADGRLNSTGPRPASVAAFLTHGLTLFPAAESARTPPGAVLVPDGVTRVQLGESSYVPTGSPTGLSTGQLDEVLRVTAVTAHVHDDLALIRLRIPTLVIPHATESGIGFGVRVPETWYSARGTVLRHFDVTTSIMVPIRPRR